MKYYFVSYSATQKGFFGNHGFGNSFIAYEGTDIRGMEELIEKENNFKIAVTLYYKEISKEEYEANI